MSNLMYNEIFVTGDVDKVNQFLSECTVDGYLSFSKCLPMPKELQPSDPKNPSFGAHAWRVEHWGTGYDCYDINEDASAFETFELDNNGLTLASADFDSEWMAPTAAINTLRLRYKDLSFFVNSMAENGSIKDICDDMESAITFDSESENEDDRRKLMENLCERVCELRDNAFSLETSFTHLLEICALSGFRDTFDFFDVTVSHNIEDRNCAIYCINFLKQIEEFQVNLKKLHRDLMDCCLTEDYDQIDSNLAFFRAFVAKILVQLNL